MALSQYKFKFAGLPRATVPLSVMLPQPPSVVTAYVKAAVGVPVIVSTFPEVEAVIPAGSPVTVAPVALPPNV